MTHRLRFRKEGLDRLRTDTYRRARRQLTKGQQAMFLAMAYEDAKRARGRWKFKDITHLNRLISSGFSDERLRDARAVLSYSRNMANGVLSGQISLNEVLAMRGHSIHSVP